MADLKKTILVELGIDKGQFITDAVAAQKEISEIKKRQDLLKKSGQEASEEFQQNAATLRVLSAELRVAQNATANFDKSLQAPTGSLEQLKAELSITTRQYNSLSEAERENSKQGQDLSKATKSLSDKLKEQEKVVGNNTREVGNYGIVTAGLKDNLKNLTSSHTVLNSAVDHATVGFEYANRNVKQASAAYGNYQAALKVAKTAQLASAEASKVAQLAQISSTAATERATAIGFKFAAGQATAAEVEAAKTIASQAATVATTTQATATNAATVATNANTAALKLFKVALASTGVGLLVIGLASLIAYFTQTEKGAEQLERIMAGLKNVFSAILKPIIGLGEGLVNAFENPKQAAKDLLSFLETNLINRFKAFGVIANAISNGDFKGAANGFLQLGTGIENITGKAKKLGTELGNAYKEGANVTALKQNAEDVTRDLIRKASKLRADANVLRAKGDAESLKQAQTYFNKADALTQKSVQTEIDAQQAFINMQEKKNLARDEDYDKLNELYAKIDQSRSLDASKAEKINARLEKQQEKRIADAQKNADALKALNEELANLEFDQNQKKKSAYDQDVANLDKKFKDLRAKASGNNSALSRIAQLDLDERKELDLKYAGEALKDQEQLEILKLQNTLRFVGENADREFELRQELLIKQRDLELSELNITESEKLRIAEEFRANKQQIDSDFETVQVQRRIDDQKQKDDAVAREIERDQEVLRVKEEFEQRKMDIANQGFDLIKSIFGKQTILAKLAFGLEKSLAIANVIMQTQKSLAANRAAEQLQNAGLSAIPIVGIGLAMANSVKAKVERTFITIGGILSGTAIAATALKFNRGGLYKSDGRGSMIYGPGSATSDSINARLSNNESVINARSTQMYKPLLSAINVAGGGKPFAAAFSMPMPRLAEGGIFDGGTTANFRTPSFDTGAIREAIIDGMSQVTIVTDVRDVTTAQDRIIKTDNRVTY